MAAWGLGVARVDGDIDMASILIIDDEEDIRDALQMVLESAGYEVKVASNGGVRTIKEMRQESPGLRIIAISGGGGVEPLAYKPGAITTTAYLAAAKEVGADRVFTKPFDRKDLIQAVDDLLGKLH